MADRNPIDFLVIGQGLAGSVIVGELESRNYSFEIYDNSHERCASLAAGGIVHPMSFKRLIPAWRAGELISYAEAHYESLEKKMGAMFYHPMKLYRPYDSIEEQNDWLAKAQGNELGEFISDSSETIRGIHQPWGVGEVKLSGRLDIPAFLNSVEQQFKDRIYHERFDHESLSRDHKDLWLYRGKYYRNVLFCEGAGYIDNPFFNYLPENATQGEILYIRTQAIDAKMLSKGCFIVPLEEANTFVVGSTYRWNEKSIELTEKGREELTDKLLKLGIKEFEILDQKSGIRPTTHDRRPLLGRHPKYPSLLLFSGMGSRTVMMAPKMALELLDAFEGKKDLHPEADIKRLEKKHFHKFETYERTKMQSM